MGILPYKITTLTKEEKQVNSTNFGTIIDLLITRDNSKPGDFYDEDGYLVCGNCHTRKQFDLEFLGAIRRVPVACKCEQEKSRIEQEEEQQRQLQNKIDEFRKSGIADPEYLKWRIEIDDKTNVRISNAVVRYINKWETMKKQNIGILFYGNVGTGKTFYAACIANGLLDREIAVLMTNIPALITGMQNDFERNKSSLLYKIFDIPLLVIDDLGSERDTPYSCEKLYEIIDTRYRSGKPLIVTTNLSPEELKNPADLRYKRVYDRILEMCHPILVTGESRRVKKAANKRKQACELLGI